MQISRQWIGPPPQITVCPDCSISAEILRTGQPVAGPRRVQDELEAGWGRNSNSVKSYAGRPMQVHPPDGSILAEILRPGQPVARSRRVQDELETGWDHNSKLSKK